MTAEIWQPDANFYEQSPRSSLIRSTCIEILTILEKVYKLKGRSKEYLPDLLVLYSQLEMYDGNLQDLGVDLEMHPDIDLDSADSDMVAEWLASQLQVWTGPQIDNLVDPESFQYMMETFYVYFDAIPPEGI